MLLKDGKKRKEKLQKINTVLLESYQFNKIKIDEFKLFFC